MHIRKAYDRVSVAGCLGYDVLENNTALWLDMGLFQLLVV